MLLRKLTCMSIFLALVLPGLFGMYTPNTMGPEARAEIIEGEGPDDLVWSQSTTADFNTGRFSNTTTTGIADGAVILASDSGGTRGGEDVLEEPIQNLPQVQSEKDPSASLPDLQGSGHIPLGTTQKFTITDSYDNEDLVASKTDVEVDTYLGHVRVGPDVSGGWISPDGHQTPMGNWTNPDRAYDDDTGTYAIISASMDWSAPLELTLSEPVYCSQVRVYSDFGYGKVDKVRIEVQYSDGTWDIIHEGVILDNAWDTYSFPVAEVQGGRYTFHFIDDAWDFWLYEFQLYKHDYKPLGYLESSNFLNGQQVTSIDFFSCDASVPGGTGLSIQFSQDTFNWFDSQGSLGSWDALVDGGNNIDLSGLGWSGSTFFYKIQMASNIGSTPRVYDVHLTCHKNPLMGEWHFDEGVGQWLVDATGNGYNGTRGLSRFSESMDPRYTTFSVSGTALDFDGNQDCARLLHNPNLNNLPALTYSAWIYPKSDYHWHVIDKGDGDKRLYANGSNLELTGRVRYSGEHAWAESVSDTLELNKWQHVAMTWNSSTGILKLYHNGQEVSYKNQTIGTGVPDDDSAWRYYFGCRGNRDPVTIFDGRIDEIRLWSSDLNATAIQNSYQEYIKVHNLDTTNEYPNLQTAIDAASPGDRLSIEDGVYNEDLYINKHIIIQDSSFCLNDKVKVTSSGLLQLDNVSMNVQNVMVMDGSSLSLDNSPNTIISHNVWVDGRVWANASSWELDCSSNGEFHITVNKTGSFIVQDNSVIRSNTAWKYLMEVKSGSVFRVENSTIRDCGWQDADPGLVVRASNIYVYNGTFTANHVGMTLNFSSYNFIRMSHFDSNSKSGLELYQGKKNRIADTSFNSNTDNGIYMDGSAENKLIGCTVSNNNDGIWIVWGSHSCLVDDTLVTSNMQHGIIVVSSEYVQLKNTTIQDAVEPIHLDESGKAKALNCVFDRSLVFYGDDASSLTVQWYMHVLVQDNLVAPQEYAQVDVRDNSSNLFYSGTSKVNGFCNWIICTEYIETNLAKLNYTPHNITVHPMSYPMVHVDPEPVMTKTRTIIVTLTSTSTDYCDNGEYTSVVHNAGFKAYWTWIEWSEMLPPGCKLEMQTRTGNSSDTSASGWSPWSGVLTTFSGSGITSPSLCQYFQYRVKFTTKDLKLTPILHDVTVHYSRRPTWVHTGMEDFQQCTFNGINQGPGGSFLLGSQQVLQLEHDDIQLIGPGRRQDNPSVKLDKEGNIYIACWEGDDFMNVMAKLHKCSNDGTRLWNKTLESRVNAGLHSTDVALTKDGYPTHFYNFEDDTTYQRFDPDSNTLDPTPIVVQSKGDYSSYGTINYDENDNFWMVWWNNDSPDYHLNFSKYQSDGTQLIPPTDIKKKCNSPVSAINSNGDLVVAYLVLESGVVDDLEMQIFDNNGVHRNTFNITEDGNHDRAPAIACDQNGNIYVAYKNASITFSDISIAKFTDQGVHEWTRTVCERVGSFTLDAPDIDVADNGDVYVTWVNTSSGKDIQMRKIDTEGNKYQKIMVCDDSDNQVNPSIDINGDDLVVVWQDYRTSDESIYGDVYDFIPQGFCSYGNITSDSIDSGVADYQWRQIQVFGNIPTGTDITISTRTSNDDMSWSPWAEVNSPVSSPPGRFLQWMVELNTTSSGRSPVITGVVTLGNTNQASAVAQITLDIFVPEIREYALLDSLWNVISDNTTDGLIDVGQLYYFNVTVRHEFGFLEVDFVNITAWHDMGDDTNTYNSTHGANLNMMFCYQNDSSTGDVGEFFMVWNGTDNETILHKSLCRDVQHPIAPNTRILTWAFTPGKQIRAANWTLPSGGPEGFNDLNSWNFNITATDDLGANNTPVHDEFGVYKYVEVTANNDPMGAGRPGMLAQLYPSMHVNSSANHNFKLNVSINNLTDGTNNISAEQVEILWSSDGGITTYGWRPFTFANESYKDNYTEFQFGDDGSWQAPFVNGSFNHTVMDWRVDIPVSQPEGTYTSPVYIRIEAEA